MRKLTAKEIDEIMDKSADLTAEEKGEKEFGNLYKIIQAKGIELVSYYKKAIQSIDNYKNNGKAQDLYEICTNINEMLKIDKWAADNFKDKMDYIYANYESIHYQSSSYLEFVFKKSMEIDDGKLTKELFKKTKIDFNGGNFISLTPIDLAINAKSNDLFEYLMKNANVKLSVNYEKDNEENKFNYRYVRLRTHDGYSFTGSPLFTMLSLYNEEKDNSELAGYINALINKGGTDLPKTLYKDIPCMNRVANFIEQIKECEENGLTKDTKSDIKIIYPLVKNNADFMETVKKVEIEEYHSLSNAKFKDFDSDTMSN